MKIYTRKGDDGSTGLLYGGRVAKSASGPEAYGAVDEAVAALGVARSIAPAAVAETVLHLQRHLFVVGAELATGKENLGKLEPGVSLTTDEMVIDLEHRIDDIEARVGMPTQFVVPGGTPLAAALDAARTVVRRAERRAVQHVVAHELTDSRVVKYLNRLADLVYMMAREAEGEWTPSKEDG